MKQIRDTKDDNDYDEDSNQPVVLSKACKVEFTVKRRSKKLKSKDDKVNQEENRPSENVQKSS